MRLRVSLGVGLTLVLWISAGLSGQDDRPTPSRLPSPAAGDWPHYTADIRGTKYSPLDQINAANFSKLEVAWRFKTDMLGRVPSTSSKARRSRSTACSTPPAARAGRWSRSTAKPAS